MSAALLEGVRILDLGIWRPVPYATQLLVEMGADVIKVEPPGGDPMRVFPELFAVLNAGKRSIVIDLKDEDGVAEVLALAADADAVMEGFRPGVADRLGVGYEALRTINPAIVYCSISGYGADGPLAQVPGHDVNYQAYAGVLRPRGGAPSFGSLPVGDLGAGVTAAMATIAACLRARTTGEGETDRRGHFRRACHMDRCRRATHPSGLQSADERSSWLRDVLHRRQAMGRARRADRGTLLVGAVPSSRSRTPRWARPRSTH